MPLTIRSHTIVNNLVIGSVSGGSSRNTFLVASSYGANSQKGISYVYDATDFSISPTIISGSSSTDYRNGRNVSINGDYIAMSGDYNDNYSGSVYVFDANSLTSEPTKLTPSDLGPNAGTFPPLTFTIDAAQTSTTVQLSGNASNTAGVNSNTFFLNASDVDLTGVRVTVTNNSTSSSRTALLASGITNLGTPTVLVSGTNTLGSYSLIADFGDVEDQVPASTATVDRTSWLGS